MSHPTIVVRRARPEDRARVEALLAAENLPLAGVAEHFGSFLIAVTAQSIAGAIGLERYGEDALLRSAVVAKEARGRGVGALLAARLLHDAAAAGVRRVFLLTTTAEPWFARIGFRPVPRTELPAALSASAELRGACPDTAVAMRLELPHPTPAR